MYYAILACLLLLILTVPCFGQEPAFVDEFDDSEGWYANNPRTPPEFSVEGGVLTLVDPPGGEVTQRDGELREDQQRQDNRHAR